MPDEIFFLLMAGSLIFGGVLHLFFPRQVLETNKRFRSRTGLKGFESLLGLSEARMVRLLRISGYIAVTIGAAVLCTRLPSRSEDIAGDVRFAGIPLPIAPGFRGHQGFESKSAVRELARRRARNLPEDKEQAARRLRGGVRHRLSGLCGVRLGVRHVKVFNLQWV